MSAFNILLKTGGYNNVIGYRVTKRVGDSYRYLGSNLEILLPGYPEPIVIGETGYQSDGDVFDTVLAKFHAFQMRTNPKQYDVLDLRQENLRFK